MSPHWRTLPELLRLLESYRRFYAAGLTDVEITARIHQRVSLVELAREARR